MLISFVEIANFRRLESVRVDFDQESTLLVGPNNSGKSSVIAAIAKFLRPRASSFRITDFTLDNLRIVNQIGDAWARHSNKAEAQQLDSRFLSPEESAHELDKILPTLDIWLSLDEDDLLRMPQAEPSLEEFYGAVGVRLRLEPKDRSELTESFCKAMQEAHSRVRKTQDLKADPAAHVQSTAESLQNSSNDEPVNTPEILSEILASPRNLVEFLDGKIDRFFEVRGYLLSATEIRGHNPFPKARFAADESEVTAVTESGMQPLGDDPDTYDLSELRAAIQIDEISATRGITERDSDGRSSRLSNLGTLFNKVHFQRSEQLKDHDRHALQATQRAAHARNMLSTHRYQPIFKEISALGYPGGGNPELLYEENIPFELGDPQLFFRHKTNRDSGLPNLDESLNGLGYQSLIYMALMLIDFRKRRMAKIESEEVPASSNPEVRKTGSNSQSTEKRRGIAPIHLVLIEEPEAFLHAQVQQVFIKQAISLLRGDGDDKIPEKLKTQIVLSTHSSHIVQQVDFSTIRYMRREVDNAEGRFPVSTIANLTNLWGDETSTKNFVSRYVRLNHCNLFFADALILVEGSAERILLPQMITRYENLKSAYLEILEVGGSHAHRLRELIDCLGVPTLIVTDIDAGTPTPNSANTRPFIERSLVSKNATLKKWLRNLRPADKNDLDYLLKLLPVEKLDKSKKVRFAFQSRLAKNPTVIPSTFEDAFILENLSLFLIKENLRASDTEPLFADSRQLRKVAEAMKIRKTVSGKAKVLWDLLNKKQLNKAELALEFLMLPESESELKPPQYISEGLDWLNDMLNEQGLLILKSRQEFDSFTAEESAISQSEPAISEK